MKPRYRAVGEIEVQKSPTDGLGLQNLASPADAESDALDANITLQTQAKILQSDSLALKVIEDLNLENTEDFKPTFNPVGWAYWAFYCLVERRTPKRRAGGCSAPEGPRCQGVPETPED